MKERILSDRQGTLLSISLENGCQHRHCFVFRGQGGHLEAGRASGGERMLSRRARRVVYFRAFSVDVVPSTDFSIDFVVGRIGKWRGLKDVRSSVRLAFGNDRLMQWWGRRRGVRHWRWAANNRMSNDRFRQRLAQVNLRSTGHYCWFQIIFEDTIAVGRGERELIASGRIWLVWPLKNSCSW